MDILLAIVVAIAVIFFGALISLGNERQRRAIDDLRDQVVQWAEQDLLLKRGKVAGEIQIDDPMRWLNTQIAKVLGDDLEFNIVQVIEKPSALLCESRNTNSKIAISPLTFQQIKGFLGRDRSRSSRIKDQNPLAAITRRTNSHKLSNLNCGALFDLELSVAWHRLADKKDNEINHLWVYIIDVGSHELI